jgi:hypothetical protein
LYLKCLSCFSETRPKRQSQTCTSKRQRSAPESSSRGTIQQHDASKFKSTNHEWRYSQLEDKQYASIGLVIKRRGWGLLSQPERNIDIDIVRELYANAYSTEGNSIERVTWVRGHQIRYDRDAINTFLGDPFESIPNKLDAFGKQVARGNWDHNLIASYIFKEGKIDGSSVRFKRQDLVPEAQVWLLLIFHNIIPKRHNRCSGTSCCPCLF